MSEEFRLKNINEITNYFHKEIQQNELISKKHKKVCTNSKLHWTSSYISFDNYCMYFNFCFCLFVCYSYMNYEFYNRIKKTCAIAAGSKTYKSIIKKKKKKYKKFFQSAFFSFFFFKLVKLRPESNQKVPFPENIRKMIFRKYNKIPFPEIWENLFWENIWIFFRANFFSFSVLYYWLYICRTLGEKQNHG